MKVYKYLINGNYLNSLEAEEWMKKNENVKIYSYLFEGDNMFYKHNQYHFYDGYFITYIWCYKGGKLPMYFPYLPKDPYTENIVRFCDDKMWCPIQ